MKKLLYSECIFLMRGNQAHGGTAGFRSPTWSIIRALQNINKAKRLEGEAIMSAPPFFHSAGRGDPKFWVEDNGLTVVVWESWSESEQEQWSKKMDKSKDSVVWCRSKKKDEEQRLSVEADGKKIFSNRSKQAKAKAEEKMDKKGGKRPGSQCAGKRGGDRGTLM